MSEGCDHTACGAIERLERQFVEFRQRNSEVHEKLWSEINTLKTNDAVQDSKYDTILNQLNTVVSEVKALQAAPGNNWKDLIKTIITTVGSVLAGFILAKLGIF